MTRILIVEDEPQLAGVLRDYLRQAGMESHWESDGREALKSFQSYQPDLVLLDLMLPGLDGLSVCREMRKTSDVPVVMVTARVEELDRLLGLELGADDYICKPYSPREVVARVKTILRRSQRQAPAAEPLLRVDGPGQCVYLKGQRLDLTPTEFRLLRLFLSQPGRVFPRDQILEATYDPDQDVTDRVIDSHIKNLRKKLARELPERELIHAVYGIGYRIDV